MRKIIMTDVFKMARIFKETELKNVIAKIFESTKQDSVAICENNEEKKQELLPWLLQKSLICSELQHGTVSCIRMELILKNWIKICLF